MPDMSKNQKIRIIFVCHGNICRSPMAEYIFIYLAKKANLEERFEVASAAVSTEETGNDIYPPAKFTLREHNIPFGPHKAHQLTREEYEYYDKVICADFNNLTYIPRIAHVEYDDIMEYFDTDEKTSLMMQWVGLRRDVSDPWYTRDFEAAYKDIYTACVAILKSYIHEFEFRKSIGDE